MGLQAMMYRRRKIATAAGAIDEVDYYDEPEQADPLLWPRPCFCEWSHLQDRLLGKPEREGIPCACAGAVPFNVPGYRGWWGEGDDHQMRRFAESVDPT